MVDLCWSFIIGLTVVCSTCLSILPTGKIAPLPPVLSSDEIYSETPCEIYPLSTWKDAQGNLWGVGDNNLWWFNKTNFSWSLLPLPNGTDPLDSWRVSCGDPSSYMALQNSIGGALVLHLPWQHWQAVDIDEVRNTIDGNASWCDMGNLYATDMARSALYLLDHEEARWVMNFDMRKDDDEDGHLFGGTTKTWIRPDKQLLLFEQNGKHSQLRIANKTEATWDLIGRSDQNTWPKLDGKVITWIQGTDKVWLWQSEGNGGEIWMFEMIKSTWQKIFNSPINEIHNLGIVLTAWVNGNEICFLCRERSCSSQYSPSHTRCWSSDELNPSVKSLLNSSKKEHENSKVVPFTMSLATNSDIDIKIVTTTSSVLHFSHPEKQHQVDKNTRKITFTSLFMPPNYGSVLEINNQDVSLPGTSPSWNQQHSNILGSVIFFGTSIAIFSIIGFFLCLRRCVHFPKEALLLRDPPSVRYTAIPDSSAVCETSSKSTAYSVIPEFIA